MRKKLCTTCGNTVSLSDYDERAGMCQHCVEVFEELSIEPVFGPAWELDWYRENFPEIELTRCNLDWLRQNY